MALQWDFYNFNKIAIVEILHSMRLVFFLRIYTVILDVVLKIEKQIYPFNLKYIYRQFKNLSLSDQVINLENVVQTFTGPLLMFNFSNSSAEILRKAWTAS